MNVPETILYQLGGRRFIAMTGAKHFVGDGNTLRMSLPPNKSKANRCWITLGADDLYTMRFFKYTAPRFHGKTFTLSDEKITEIESVDGVWFDQLQEIFTRITGMYTHL